MDSAVKDNAVAALLFRAKMSQWGRDWESAENLATMVIERSPGLVAAYIIRALARRVRDNMPAAISDYDRIIDLDPHCVQAWEYRGACRSTQASRLPRAQARELQTQAERDFRQATRLDPANEQAALSMVEAAICAERYREAFGYAGECWRSMRSVEHRIICAWLGCIAGLLARRPAHTWAQYADLLRRREASLSRLEWCVAEINGALARVYESRAYHADTLAELEKVHALFLGHFGQEGPLLQ